MAKKIKFEFPTGGLAQEGAYSIHAHNVLRQAEALRQWEELEAVVRAVSTGNEDKIKEGETQSTPGGIHDENYF